MPVPLASATSRLRDIINQLEKHRNRVASLRLLALDDDFFGDLARGGGGDDDDGGDDVAALKQAIQLFGCLMEASYARGFSRPVDRAVNKLLLHAIMGCERTLSRLRSRGSGGGLHWLLPSEMEIKELLEECRSFLGYITSQGGDSDCTARRPDPSLVEARRRLHRLCPRINNLSIWSVPPARVVATRSSRQKRPEGHAQRHGKVQGMMPTPPSTSSANIVASVTQIVDLIVPTEILATRRLNPAPKRRGRSCTAAAVQIVDNMVEEVTQPFTITPAVRIC